MKIQLDYEHKIITLDQDTNLGEFMDKVQTILPDWKEWKLETHTTISRWQNPVIIEKIEYPTYPSPNTDPLPWWQQPTITCQNVDGIKCETPTDRTHNRLYNLDIR